MCDIRKLIVHISCRPEYALMTARVTRSRNSPAEMSTASRETPERYCRRVFPKLLQLGEELKKHDHEEVHFNIEHAVQYVKHHQIDEKFRAKACTTTAAASQELASTLHNRNKNLKKCLEICSHMGKPEWNKEQDSRLAMAWTSSYADLSNAGQLLELGPLDAQAFLAFNRPSASVCTSLLLAQ